MGDCRVKYLDKKMWAILKPFQRVTHGRGLLPEIDGLRFVAIISVVFFHLDVQMWARYPLQLKEDFASIALHEFLLLGNFGVPLFFAISGFILSLPMIKEVRDGNRAGLREYYLRRLTRIEPPYFINMILLALAYLVIEGKDLAVVLPHLCASLAYVHNIAYGVQSTLNSVAWSLEVEVQFYLIAPFLIRYLYALKTTMRLVLIVLVCFFGFAVESYALIPILSILSMIQYFLIGLLVAEIYANGRFRPVRLVAHGGGALCVVLSILLYWLCRVHVVALQGVAAGVLIFSLLSVALWGNGWIRRFLGHPLVYVIGGMCYTIYLWHGPIWRRVWVLLFGHDFSGAYWNYYLLKSLFFVPFIIIVSAFLFLIFEKPFMRRQWPESFAGFFRKMRLKYT